MPFARFGGGAWVVWVWFGGPGGAAAGAGGAGPGGGRADLTGAFDVGFGALTAAAIQTVKQGGMPV